MKFTILSHAGMLVESGGTSLMTDPWLLGSCYWRSWWNYPTPPEWCLSLSKLDFIYVTHMHWDHFHGPSLRKLPSSTTVLIPEAHYGRMLADMADFDFKKIVELPHGKSVQLSPDLRVTSYQFGLSLDSTLVMTDGRTTLVDMNDCKLTGLPLRQLLRRFPHIDFVFRSHSSASPYPHCVSAVDPEQLRYRTNEDYVSEFVETVRVTKARHGIPFASNHCFLHRDTIKYNSTAVSPYDVARHFEQLGATDSKCVVMIPGDSWSERDGFQLQEHDYFTDRERHIAELAAQNKEKLDQCYRQEEPVRLSFAAFRNYFQRYMQSLPWFLRRLSRPIIVFRLANRREVEWVLDFEKRRVLEHLEPGMEWQVRITSPEAVIADCIHNQLFAVWSASKRLSVELGKGALWHYLVFAQLLDMYEYDYFPLRKMLNLRFARVWARRWREAIHYIRHLGGRLVGGHADSESIRSLVPKISAK